MARSLASSRILASELLSMTWQTSSHESLRRVLTEYFKTRDLAEPLVSLDAATPALSDPQRMPSNNATPSTTLQTCTAWPSAWAGRLRG